MAISDQNIVEVELTDTFDYWRNTTNQIVTIVNENTDFNPVTQLLSANSLGGLEINSISVNSVSVINISGTRITFTGGQANVNFQSANVASLGNVHQVHILGGLTISGSNPSSSISNTQINNSEINLNGQTLKANGASEIILTGADVKDLGVIRLLNVEPETIGSGAGTMSGVNVNMTSTYPGTLNITTGEHVLLGALFQGGTFYTTLLRDSAVHSSNITVNTGATFISNSSVMLATDYATANVGVGNFPEWSSGANRLPTSSSGKVHIRTDFAAATNQKTSVSALGDELVLEGNTGVGMTLLANTASNTEIYFGDNSDPDQGFIRYNNSNDHLVFGAKETQQKMRIQSEYGGSLQIAGANTFETLSGKLHIYQQSADGADALYINSEDGDKRAVRIDSGQTIANVVDISTVSLTSGNMLSLRYEPSTIAFTGTMLDIIDDNQSVDTRTVVQMYQEHKDAIGTTLLDLKTDAGKLLKITQNANDKTTINVYSNGTIANTIDVVSSSLTTGTLLHIESSSASHSTNVVSIINSSESSSPTSLYIENNTQANKNVVAVSNSTASLFFIESGGNLGVNINGQTVKYLYSNTSLLETTADVPLYKLHVGGTLGVEANALFNHNVRMNGNVVIQNSDYTTFAVDSPDVGTAVISVGENASTIGHQALHFSYPAGDGLAYAGMGAIQSDGIPLYKAIRFNGYNPDLIVYGNVVFEKTLSIEGNTGVEGNITSNGTMSIIGNTFFSSNSVSIETWDNGGTEEGIITIQYDANILGDLFVGGPISAPGMEIGGDMIVTGESDLQGNTVVGDILTTDTLQVINHANLQSSLNVAGKVAIAGDNVWVSSGSSVVTLKGKLHVDGDNVHVSKSTSNTTLAGNFNLGGNATFNSTNVYVSLATSNTTLAGNFNLGGNATFNGSNVYVSGASSNTFIRGGFTTDNKTVLNKDVVTITRTSSTESLTVVKNNLQISGNAQFLKGISLPNANADFTQHVTIGKNLEVSGNVSVAKNVTVGGTLNVNNGDIVGDDNMTLAGKLTVAGANVHISSATSNTSLAGNLFVAKNATIKGTLNVNDGDIIGSQDMALTGSLTASLDISGRNITASGTLNSTGNINLVNGTVVATKSGSTRTTKITGTAEVTSNFEVGGTLNVTGSTTFAAASFTSLTTGTFTATGTMTTKAINASDNINVTGTGKTVKVSGVNCRLPVYNAAGTLLNAA